MKIKHIFIWGFALVSSAFSAVTLSSDFTDGGSQRDPLYNFWKVRNEIPAYPNVGSQQPPQYHDMNCIRLLGGWPPDEATTVGEDACVWNETTQQYEYRMWKIINRIDGVLSKGYGIHQLVLDNPPWCFQRGLTFSPNPGPGEYDIALKESAYGNSLPPGEPEAWHDFIVALMNKLVDEYGQELVDTWRFRVHTEADFYPHHWAGTKMDYFEHYSNTAHAVRSVLPNAKLAAHFLEPTSGDRYGPEFVTWCSQNNVPYDFIGISYYPFYNIANRVDVDRLWNLNLKPFVDAPGWNTNAVLEIPEYSLFTEKDDDGYNMGVGTSHNPAFVAMLARMLYEKSIAHVHNWGDQYDDPVYLALEGMLGKNRFANQKTGTPVDSDNEIDGIFAADNKRQSIDAMIFSYNPDPAYIADETVNLSFAVPFPAGTTYEYRIAVCDQANNPHYQFVQEYPLAGKWQSEGGWVLDRINPASANQTDKNGLLDQILTTTGKNLWKSKKSTYPGYQSLVWSGWNTLTTTSNGGVNSTVELTLPLSSFSFQKIELRTEAEPIGIAAHWPLDEGSGAVANDASGYGSDGELLNGATWGSDATRGSYVSFDGTDDRISTPFTYALSDADDFTWAWWANKQSDASEDEYAIMVGNRFGGTGSETFEFIKLTGTKAEFSNTDDAGQIEKYDYTDLPTGEWHHYAMVKSGTNYQWYVDGVAQGVASNFNYNETSAIPFFIGGDGNNQPNEHFQGFIDDVVLYRKALTAVDVPYVMNGYYDPVVTLTNLGSLVDSTDGSVWSDGLPAHGGAYYVIPSTGNVHSESGTSTFPGISLTVEAGGQYQVRSTASDATTVDELILAGGTGANYALLAAGLGTDAVNTISGKITNSGSSKLISYGVGVNRDLKVVSQVDGDGILRAVGGASVIIDHSANSFSGTWQVDSGATLQFNHAGAVGTADIEVLDSGTLSISGNWNSGATLTVADTASTQVDFGNHAWFVSNLVFGGAPVEEGVYSASELSALGNNPVFSGSGFIRVGAINPDAPVAHWKLDEGSGTVAADSANRYTGTLHHDPTWGSDATRGTFVSFDGNDDRISTLFTYALSSNDDFSWAWWANRQSTGDGDENAVMVGNRYGGTGAESLEFVKMTPTKGEFFNGTGENYDYEDITSAGWHHYAMVKTGNSYQWYVDGVVQGVASNFNYNETSPVPFNIGGDDDDEIAGGREGEHFEGFIDDVVLYDRALTSNDVVDVKNGIYGEPVDPPMVDFVMSGGNMVFDWVGSGFKVQMRTNLTAGIWVDVPGSATPPVTNSPVYPEAFYRLIGQ